MPSVVLLEREMAFVVAVLSGLELDWMVEQSRGRHSRTYYQDKCKRYDTDNHNIQALPVEYYYMSGTRNE